MRGIRQSQTRFTDLAGRSPDCLHYAHPSDLRGTARPAQLTVMPNSARWMSACSCGHSHGYSL
jgi:hypothetical protein